MTGAHGLSDHYARSIDWSLKDCMLDICFLWVGTVVPSCVTWPSAVCAFSYLSAHLCQDSLCLPWNAESFLLPFATCFCKYRPLSSILSKGWHVCGSKWLQGDVPYLLAVFWILSSLYCHLCQIFTVVLPTSPWNGAAALLGGGPWPPAKGCNYATN